MALHQENVRRSITIYNAVTTACTYFSCYVGRNTDMSREILTDV